MKKERIFFHRTTAAALAGIICLSLAACEGNVQNPAPGRADNQPAATVKEEMSATEAAEKESVTEEAAMTAPAVENKAETSAAESRREATVAKTENPEETPEWKALMLSAIDDRMNEYWENNGLDGFGSFDAYIEQSQFAFLFIDDDDIPEVFVMPASGVADGSSILYVKDGRVESYDIGWSDSVSYLQRKGVICLYHGMHVPGVETIMTFPGEEVLGTGQFAEPGWFDGTDHSVDGADMEYQWDEAFVSEKEYQEKKDALFKGEIREANEEKSMTYEEVKSALEKAEV